MSVDANAADIVTADVLPISFVDASVYSIFEPFHTTIISPVLELVPFLTVYFINADVYEPVTLANKLFVPTIDEATVA
jgi:hypothetical protein